MMIPFEERLEAMMSINVKLSEELVEEVKRIAEVEHRSVPKQIEFYYRIARIAEDNPDMSFKLMKEILLADAEEAVEEYQFG